MKVQYSIGCIETRGKSITSARDQAIIEANEALSRDFTPFVFQDKGKMVIVYAEATSYAHKIIDPDHDSTSVVRMHGGTGYPTRVSRTEAIGRALYHFAQSFYPTFAEVPEACQYLMRTCDRDELRWWYQARERYAAEAARSQVAA